MKINKILLVFVLVGALVHTGGCASSAPALNNEVDQALNVFREQVGGADVFLNQAAGYLVFPRVIKAGVGIGGETGEGVLRVGGSTVAYYRTTSGSIGWSPWSSTPCKRCLPSSTCCQWSCCSRPASFPPLSQS